MPLAPDGTRLQHDPSQPPFFNDVEDSGKYGIELVLAWTVGEPPNPVRIHPRDFERARWNLIEAVCCDHHEVVLLFYGWWNGGDEPITW